ncbi:MAG: thioredoxin [Vicinamibacterales bacterium]
MAWTSSPDGLVTACPACGQKIRVHFDRLDARGQCGKCHQPLPAVAEPVEVPSAEAFDALIAAARLPVLVDFWAPWCGPCHMVAPELAKVAQSHAGTWIVAKVDTDRVTELGARLVIRSIPTLMLFTDGQLRHRMSGALPAEGIEQFVAAGLSQVR